MRKIFTLIMSVMAFGTGASFYASARDTGLMIEGVIVDSEGVPVTGASVFEKGTTNGTMSDLDGRYMLEVEGEESVIVISCIGFRDVEMSVTSKQLARVVLKQNTETLEGVVVIGYGTIKKSDLTGSVSTVNADEINRGMAVSPGDLLKGKSAGVVVTPGDGAPGSGATIRIRGGASLNASNDPLIIIDGLPVNNGGISGVADPLSAVNPNDIESFSVLKDASATAIYGSRASNGVIVITTKKGSAVKSSKPHIDFDFKTSVSHVTDFVGVLNADEIRNLMAERYGRDSKAYMSLGSADTDWQKEIYRVAPSYEGNVSLTGRNRLGSFCDLPYRISAGYLHQDGVLKEDRMKRGTISLNLNPNFFDNHLKIALNGKTMFLSNEFANRGAIEAAVRMNPTHPVRDKEGIHGYFTHFSPESNGVNAMATCNPVALLKDRKDHSNALRFIGNVQIDYKSHIFEALRFNLNLGIDYADSDGYTEVARGSEQSLHNNSENGSGSRNDYDFKRTDKTLETYVAYDKNFAEKHHVDAMAGYSWQKFHNKSNFMKVKLSNGERLNEGHPAGELFLISFFGRLNYSYDDRYMVTATLRNDGTSRFINNKWGLFPSVALGWNISNENFMKDNDVINTMRIRLSWGKTGQQDVGGYYDSQPVYMNNKRGSHYQFGGKTYYPITALGYNADLKWETTDTYNAGMDFGFLRDRITAGFDLYYRKTTDMINYIPVPALANLTNYLNVNIGSMENKGFEFNVNTVIIDNDNLTWSLGANMAYNHSEITKLTASPDDKSGVETGGIRGGTGNNVQMHQVNFPPYAFYVYEQVYDKYGNPIEGEYVDRNGNGIIDEGDRYFCHKPSADVTMGFNSVVSYGKLTLAVSGHGSFGNRVYNNVASDGEMLGDLWTNNFTCNRLKSARSSAFENARYLSDYYVRDASFFKIDNMTLGYDFPNLLGAGASRPLGLNLFFTVQNVATITSYDGLDPEIFNGIDCNLYPRPRKYIFGLKLNF